MRVRWQTTPVARRTRLVRLSTIGLLATGLLLGACAPPPRPAVFVRVAAAAEAPASAEAAQWAPQAHAHALGLADRAEEALSAGDVPASEALAEQAIAAHEHAWVLSRLARAERRRIDAEASLQEQRRVFAELHAQHQRLSAEAAGLELRAQVVRDSLPLPEHDKAAPERRRARRRAAAALATQGRLLCLATRMLQASPELQATVTELDTLDAALDAGAGSNVLETATRLRSQCLGLLSKVRRGPNPTEAASKPEAGNSEAGGVGGGPVHTAPSADVLLAELSRAGTEPSRDDRGVAVVLRELFDAQEALSSSGREELSRLARVAKAHPAFPVMLVGHTGAPRRGKLVDRRLEVVTQALSSFGLGEVATHNAGLRQPLLPRISATASERNERLELVFVAPGL